MQQPSHVYRDRPTVTLRLTRDSVAAGDDVDAPHERQVEVPSFLDPVALVRHLATEYLPHVGGRDHFWMCRLDGQPIATVQGNVASVRALTPRVAYPSGGTVHFAYTSAAQ